MKNYKWIIQQLRPGEAFETKGDGSKYTDITKWLADTEKPTKEECDMAWDNGLEAESDKSDNRKARKEQYPAITDQIDAIYKAIKAIRDGESFPPEVDKWIADLDKVKADNPV